MNESRYSCQRDRSDHFDRAKRRLSSCVVSEMNFKQVSGLSETRLVTRFVSIAVLCRMLRAGTSRDVKKTAFIRNSLVDAYARPKS